MRFASLDVRPVAPAANDLRDSALSQSTVHLKAETTANQSVRNIEVVRSPKRIDAAAIDRLTERLRPVLVQIDQAHRAVQPVGSAPLAHSLLVRTGSRNLPPFAHVDLRHSRLGETFVEQLDGAVQFYTLTFGGSTRRLLGEFWFPGRARQLSSIAMLVPVLGLQGRGRESTETPDGWVMHVPSRCVHTAPGNYTPTRLFMGDQVSVAPLARR